MKLFSKVVKKKKKRTVAIEIWQYFSCELAATLIRFFHVQQTTKLDIFYNFLVINHFEFRSQFIEKCGLNVITILYSMSCNFALYCIYAVFKTYWDQCVLRLLINKFKFWFYVRIFELIIISFKVRLFWFLNDLFFSEKRPIQNTFMILPEFL